MSTLSGISGPVALVGANGMLARMVRKRAPQGLDLLCYDLPDFDMTKKAVVAQAFSEHKPKIIINCAAFTAVDTCEEQEEMATFVNAFGVGLLADMAHDLDATIVHISTDYVFPGTQRCPYREDDPLGPVSAYGRSKLKGELEILSKDLDQFFIVRTGWLYGPGGNNFVETVLRLAAEREELRIVADQIGSPTYTADLADAIFNLLETAATSDRMCHSPYGIYHFSNDGQCSWYEFACAIVEEANNYKLPVKVREIRPIRTEEYPLPAKRPFYSVLSKEKYRLVTAKPVPEWHDALKRYFAERLQ